ncbi:MAG: hypothetical protein Q9201_003449 [Fulgogasparrea decipioides]
MHILPAIACYCARNEEGRKWGLISSAPPGMEIAKLKNETLVSLSDCINYSTYTNSIAHALNQRFVLATKIATAVLYVHCNGWVHKSLRSNTILMFERVDAKASRKFPQALGEPFLSGFMYARRDHDPTPKQYGQLFSEELDVYRHPDRQGREPATRFSMCHDVYSLGVILLEIGLWRRVGIPLESASVDGVPSLEKTAQNMKESLVKRARSLRVKIGQKYQDVVMLCLNIGENEEIGSVKYIKQISEKLEELSLVMN